MRVPIDPRRSIVLERKGRGSDGVTRSTGSISCGTCGGSPMNRNQLAQAIGVSPHALGKFLNREPVRADVAASIRASVARVVE